MTLLLNLLRLAFYLGLARLYQFHRAQMQLPLWHPTFALAYSQPQVGLERIADFEYYRAR